MRSQERFERNIEAGEDRRASAQQKARGAEAAEALRALIRPFFLRRVKAELVRVDPSAVGAAAVPVALQPPTPVVARSRSMLDDSSAEAKLDLARSLSESAAPPAGSSSQAVAKTDVIVWCTLAPIQEELYRIFLNSPLARQALNSSRSPLAACTVLKKICDHPR